MKDLRVTKKSRNKIAKIGEGIYQGSFERN